MKLTLILIFLFFLNVGFSDVSREECFRHPLFGTLYSQSQFKLNDHLEDWALLSRARFSRDNLLEVLKLKKIDILDREQSELWVKQNCSSYLPQSELPARYEQKEVIDEVLDCRQEYYDQQIEHLKCTMFNVSRKAPFKKDEMIERLQNVIKVYEEKNKDKKVFVGEFHDWDQSKKKELAKEFPQSLVFSKILTSLALGVSSKFLKTPNDTELRSWLESQDVVSVEIEDLFLKSLELNQGDLYLTLLSIENILSEYWKTPRRDQIIQTTRLKSITNHCPGSKPEDVYGSWYHMFGMMLYGCVSGPVAADFVARTENTGSRILDAKSVKREGENVLLHLLVGSDPQEEKINRISGHVGHGLCKAIREKSRN